MTPQQVLDDRDRRADAQRCSHAGGDAGRRQDVTVLHYVARVLHYHPRRDLA